jgi:pimeloyl-ACP methyl ester carboxylesterase
MQPRPSLPPAQFHDWYNNEHGPARLRLPFIAGGFRYRATDLSDPAGADSTQPEWMAVYDILDMAELAKEPYATLRQLGVRSPREAATMAQIAIDRRLYDLVSSTQAASATADGAGAVLISLRLSLHSGQRAAVNQWYANEHIPLLAKVPGWLRTRLFAPSALDDGPAADLLVLHECARANGLGGPEWLAATSTPGFEEVMATAGRGADRRAFALHYTFGPAPRDLEPLTSGEAVAFVAADGRTRTVPATEEGGSSAAIESYVTAADGVTLPYRLEGAGAADAPLLVLSNSLLTDWRIWDEFVAAFVRSPPNRRFRILRYRTRGRPNDGGDGPVTLDVLAADVVALLDAMRVPRAAAVIGVSLGGATALNAALKHPRRFARFVACDTNATSPGGNSKAWAERIGISEEEGAIGDGGRIVGERLAELTVRRWFAAESYDAGEVEKRILQVKAMVKENGLEGFRKSVEALYQYDMSAEMKRCQVKGIFVVGGQDGNLPGAMKEMAASLGSGGTCEVINGAGHLPMVEKPQEFADIMTKFVVGL